MGMRQAIRYEGDLLRNFQGLSIERKREVVDFVSFLAAKELKKDRAERMKLLAKKAAKGAATDMTEEEILEEIRLYRAGK